MCLIIHIVPFLWLQILKYGYTREWKFIFYLLLKSCPRSFFLKFRVCPRSIHFTLLTTVHSFLYVQVHFKTFRTPSWNNYYIITNVPTKLCQSQMTQIFGPHHTDSFIFFTIPTNCAISTCKLVFCLVLRRVNVLRIYSSISKKLKIDWSIQVTWRRRPLAN